jgi:4-carboxymuconolactone decarboxylase
MDTKDLHDRGLKMRVGLFGPDAVEKRMKEFGDFGKPLQHMINAYAYGDVWQGRALPMATKSLAVVAMLAAIGRPNELRVHLKGALKNGCSADEIQEILLLVAIYCGIPAAIEAYRSAVEVLREAKNPAVS